ncbi:hypothetical protein EAS62_38845 [Bradyrhizobium zhanjiangense]|uniref:Uncharacterized protein n=1 Tax=Bradyrhizobium zhanjiangense TaxID=1325107 RepID=A0ABY0D8Y3_9BRAD|nr:hypothetical protein EAS62_38845 [Bradyrhizobium zhanjiangense]
MGLLRNERLSDLAQHELANLVNSFSNPPEVAACRKGTVAIAEEVLRRADRDTRLPEFTYQDLTSLVNDFSRRPDEASCHRAIANSARNYKVKSSNRDSYK